MTEPNRDDATRVDSPEFRWPGDDRDSPRNHELVIGLGGNGDYYVAVVPPGEGCLGRSVRICTSGGTASRNPALLRAISEAWRAMAPPGTFPEAIEPSPDRSQG